MDDKAKVYTFSIIHSATEAFQDKTPYVVAVVEDTAGKRLARVEGYSEKVPVKIGMDVMLSKVDDAGNAVYTF